MAKLFSDLSNRRYFAPVAPVKVLKALEERCVLAPYNLVLAHNVVENKEEFSDLFRYRGIRSTTIIDNSVIELGRPVEAEMLREAYGILRANTASMLHDIVCVLPDVLLDGAATVQVAREALIKFRKLYVDNLMFVPQGRSMSEIIACAEAMSSVEEIRWIGVAKNFVDILGTRWDITRILQCIFPHAKFHMLGFSRNTQDDIICTLNHGVEGIDSSMPLRCDTPISFNSSFPKRGNWWQEDMECTDIMAHNVSTVQNWLGNTTKPRAK